MSENITAHPLCWPTGTRRTNPNHRTIGAFAGRTIPKAFQELRWELERLGARSFIISSNYAVKADGMPYAQQPKSLNSEPGVAVFFKDRKGRDRAMACDTYTTADRNAWAIKLTIEALRGIDRWGVSDVLDRVFEGFAALPQRRPWFDVLGVKENAPLSECESAYRKLARSAHPDAGGTHEAMAELNAAIEEARAR